MPVGDIAAMLNDRAEALARELFPNGIKDGVEWRVGSLAGEKGRSLAIRIGGGRLGVWSDFAGGVGGDALDLVAQALFGGDKKDAVAWAKDWLGIDDSSPRPAPRRPAPPPAKAGDDNQTSRAAYAIWLAASDSIFGTPAEAYLAGRGIDFDLLKSAAGRGRILSALRFHDNLWNAESRRHWPALVAAVHGRDGRIVAVHRTWFRVDGGLVAKAPLTAAKMTLGRYRDRGGCIRLWRGAGGQPLAKAAAGSDVLICEGIEDALTLAMAKPDRRVLCGISVSSFKNIQLPAAVTTVVLGVDNDPPGSKAADAVDKAVAAFQAQGRTVRIARPPAGFKDFNEVLMKGGVDDA